MYGKASDSRNISKGPFLFEHILLLFRRLIRNVLREAFLRDCFAFSWTPSYTSSCRNNPYHILVYMCCSISCDQLKMICTIYIYHVSSVLVAIGYHFILRIRCPSLQYSGKPHLKCKKKVQHIGGEFRTFEAHQKKASCLNMSNIISHIYH